jgi:hypothetical protein
VFGARWYAPIHDSNLLFFVLVTITDTAVGVFFLWVRMRRHTPEQPYTQEGGLEAGDIRTQQQDEADINNASRSRREYIAYNRRPRIGEDGGRQVNDHIYNRQSGGNEHRGQVNDTDGSQIRPIDGPIQAERATGSRNYNGVRTQRRMPRAALSFGGTSLAGAQDIPRADPADAPPIELHPIFQGEITGTREINVRPAVHTPLQQSYAGNSSQRVTSATSIDLEEHEDNRDSQRI